MEKTRNPTFPLDLMEAIMDELSDDKKALLKCSLLSKSFINSTRRHLFFTITIDSSNACLRLLGLLKESPHLGLYVRRLEIKMEPKVREDVFWWASQPKAFSSILRILRVHKRITSVNVDLETTRAISRVVLYDKMPVEVQSAFIEFLRSSPLVDLALRFLLHFPATHLADFPMLKRLDLDHSDAPVDFYPVEMHDEPRLSTERRNQCSKNGRLETLSLDCMREGTKPLVEALISRDSLLRLTSLRALYINGFVDHYALQKLTMAAGPSLETFTWLHDEYKVQCTFLCYVPMFHTFMTQSSSPSDNFRIKSEPKIDTPPHSYAGDKPG